MNLTLQDGGMPTGAEPTTLERCRQPQTYLPRGIRQRVKFEHCVFCQNNGEDEM
jgi:hypothetical protein